MRALSLFACLLALPGGLRFGKAEPDEALNRAFANREGWIGGDGAFSVPLSRDSSLWLFSDTWIGRVVGGARKDAGLVNNTAGVMDRGKVRFIVAHSPNGKAEALVKPADGVGWFWLGPGAVVGGKLHVFLSQIVKTNEASVFGFRAAGLWLGIWHGTDLQDRRVGQLKVPFARFTDRREVSFGFALCRSERWIYVYGTDEDVLPSHRDRFLTVARCPAEGLADFKSWQFWTGKAWSPDSAGCARTIGGMASVGSVSFLPRLRRYVLVYTEGGLSPRVLARWSTSPVGPWSEAVEVYRCPEGDRKGVFCYGAMNHPELARGNELVISYCTNAFELGQVLEDAMLYVPRFVRVPVRAVR